MNRRTATASTARTAPFGTDVQPTLKVKIVGGKRMEVVVDPPPSSAGTQKSLAPLQNGPNGTPPMQYQPLVKESHNTSNGFHNSRQAVPGDHRKIYSQTAPSDSSNSHIHARGNLPGTPKILPPISPADGDESGQDTRSETNNEPTENYQTIKDILQKPFPVQLPSSPVLSPIDDRRSLTEQVSRLLAGYDPLHFKEMYTDLADFDCGLCGFVSQPQMNMIAHKHKLPIPITTLRLIFSNFAKETNPDQVNYERMIQFLARAQLGSAKAQTLLQENVNKFVNDTESSPGKTDLEMQRLDEEISRFEEKEQEERQLRQSYREASRQRDDQGRNELEKEKWKPSFQPKKPLRMFSELDNTKLIRMLEEQFSEGKKKGTVDVEGLREMCLKKDRRQQGTITEKDLQDVCLFYRIPVQGSLMNKMLQRIDTGDGQLSWVAFIEFLEQVNYGEALTPRQRGDQRGDLKGSAERPADRSADTHGNGSVRRVSDRTVERPRDRSASSLKLSVPSIELIRPSTWPKRPSHDVLPTPAEPKRLASPPWQRKPLARIETRPVEEPDVTSVEMEITRNDTPTDQHVTPSPLPTTPPHRREAYEVEQLHKLARGHQVQQRARQEEAVMKKQHQQKQDHEEWFKGFLHMAKGLYSNDTSKTGCLHKEEMLRLVNNYNLIYQLGIETSHIKRVIDTCCHEGDEVPIQPVLEILRQKKK